MCRKAATQFRVEVSREHCTRVCELEQVPNPMVVPSAGLKGVSLRRKGGIQQAVLALTPRSMAGEEKGQFYLHDYAARAPSGTDVDTSVGAPNREPDAGSGDA
jgi:hypothetical protein